jgi:raffinose/stachyose/melibiose transport system substrate-binding protein
MKKATVVLSIIFLLSTTMLFAGGQRERAAGKGEAMTLTMLSYQDLADPITAPNWEIVLNSFYASHPNIKLEIEYGFDEPYHNKLQAMLVADQLPDLMFLWPGKRTGQITSSGKIKDLRAWLKGHESEFAAIAVAPQGAKGEIWELPEQVTDTHVMYTNTKYMKDLALSFPKTMDELLAQGDKISAKGLIPIAMTNKAGWQMQSCLLSALCDRAGGMDWYNRVIVGKNASFADQEFVNALSVIDTLSKRQMFSPGINQADYGQALTDFVTEKAVYYIDGGWRVNNLVGELTDEQKGYVELKTFPDIPNQKGTSGSTASVAGTGYGMHSKLQGEKADAAWAWIWYYSGPVGSAIRQGHGANPAYKLPTPGNLDVMVKKLIKFVADTPAGYVIDAKMDAEGMGVLHPAIQEMILGKRTPQQVAQEYEAWVAANDSNRK